VKKRVVWTLIKVVQSTRRKNPVAPLGLLSLHQPSASIPSYKDWTNPNTILQFMLMIIFIIRFSIIPELYFHIEVSWFMMVCVRWVHMRWYCWTDLINLRVASLIHESSFAIVDYERDVKMKGIRILWFIICF